MITTRALRLSMWAAVLGLGACTVAQPADRLKIETHGFRLELGYACLGVGIAGFVIERDGDALRFTQAGVEKPLKLIWPYGFFARLEAGQAVLYTSDGKVVGREGDVINDAGTCETIGDATVVGSVLGREYR